MHACHPVGIAFTARPVPHHTCIAVLTGVGQLGRVSKLPRTLKVLRLLKFARILRVLHLNAYFNKVSSFLVLRPAINRIIVSVFWAFILSHIIACLW